MSKQPYTTITEVRHNDSTVAMMLHNHRPLSEIVIALANQKVELLAQLTQAAQHRPHVWLIPHAQPIGLFHSPNINPNTPQ